MATLVHPTAVVEEGAKLGSNVKVGPLCYVGANVELGDDTQLDAHVVVDGHTKLGVNNRVYPFTSIGTEPQSISYRGEPTKTLIGDNNVLRENITINRGTMDDEGVTEIGSDNLFMAYVHIAHDCRLGSNLMFSNNASLAGHVRVSDYVILAGFTLVHQFVRIGEYSFCGVNTYCTLDVPPYMLVAGDKAITHGINARGMKRRGVDKESLQELKRAYRTIYRSGHTMTRALEEIDKMEWHSDKVEKLAEFIRSSKRGVIR